MYNLSKLNSVHQGKVTFYSNTGVSRLPEFSLAVAKAIANNLALPSSEVESILSFYNMQCSTEVNLKIDLLNELMPLDIKTVKDTVLRFYTFRYSAVVPPVVTMAFNKENAIEDFFGISKSFDKVSIELIKTKSSDISAYCNIITEVLCSLTEPCVQD